MTNLDYLYNVHGDVTNLMNGTTIAATYYYDALGNVLEDNTKYGSDYWMEGNTSYFTWDTYRWVIARINENLKDTTSKDTTTKNPTPPGGGNNGNTGSPGGGVYNPPVIKQEKPTNLLNMDIGIFINTFYKDKDPNRPFRAWIEEEDPNTLHVEYFFAFAGDFKGKYNESDDKTITHFSPGLYPPSNPSDQSLYDPGHIDIYPYYHQANKEPGLLK